MVQGVWHCRGHLQLHKQCWVLDRIALDIISILLEIANHEYKISFQVS